MDTFEVAIGLTRQLNDPNSDPGSMRRDQAHR